jgi:hypothetical protein
VWLPWDMALLLALSLAGAGIVLRRTSHRLGVGAAPFVLEAAIVAVLYALWQYAGQITVLDMSGAFDNARLVWDIERVLMLPHEASVQEMLLPHGWLVQVSNIYYAGVHVPAMGIFLVWLFALHRSAYPSWRNALALVTGLCLLLQLIPVAPPRFMEEYGIVDTPLLYGQSVYGALGRGIAGQLQAMPSIHVAWAAVIAWAVWELAPRGWRWLGVAHLVLTSYVVVVTGNHFWLDGIVAMVLLALVVAAERALRVVAKGVAAKELSATEPAGSRESRDAAGPDGPQRVGSLSRPLVRPRK